MSVKLSLDFDGADEPALPDEIIEWDKARQRQREERAPAQIPLYIDNRPPPPGWDEDETCDRDDNDYDSSYEISLV